MKAILIYLIGMAMTMAMTKSPAEVPEETLVPAPYVSHCLPQHSYFKKKQHKRR